MKAAVFSQIVDYMDFMADRAGYELEAPLFFASILIFIARKGATESCRLREVSALRGWQETASIREITLRCFVEARKTDSCNAGYDQAD